MKKLILAFMMSVSTLAFAQQAQVDSTKTTAEKFEKTDQVLSKILDKSLAVFEKTGSFIMEQAPDVLKEFYIWHTAKHIFWIVFAVAFFLLCRYIPYMWLQKDKDNFNRYDDGWYFKRYGEGEMIIAWFMFGIGLVISLLMLAIHIYELIFILVSPKLYLIEYILSLRQS